MHVDHMLVEIAVSQKLFATQLTVEMLLISTKGYVLSTLASGVKCSFFAQVAGIWFDVGVALTVS